MTTTTKHEYHSTSHMEAEIADLRNTYPVLHDNGAQVIFARVHSNVIFTRNQGVADGQPVGSWTTIAK